MRSSIVIVVAACILMASAGAYAQGKTIDGDLSDWGWDAVNKVFDPTGHDVEFCTLWDVTNNVITDEWDDGNNTYSGGEWFDIEALCMDVVYDYSNRVNRLNWAMITSYAGWEPKASWEDHGEWDPNTNWNGDPSGGWGNAVSGRGRYAAERDNYPALSWKTNTYDFAYPVNPWIGISLDDAASNNPLVYEYGLIVDPSDTQTLGNIDVTNSQLWKVTDGWKAGTNNTWVPGCDYEEDVCFNVAGGTGNEQLLSNGTSVRRYGYWEAENTQWENGTHPWDQYHNWFWEGSIDVSSLNLDFDNIATASGLHYSMWCGNDHAEAFFNPAGGGGPTPELPPGALLILGMAPLGLRWWRNRRQ